MAESEPPRRSCSARNEELRVVISWRKGSSHPPLVFRKGADKRKKRRSSYHVRKDEKLELEAQLKQLQLELKRLTTVQDVEPRIMYTPEQLRAQVEANHMALAGAASIAAAFRATVGTSWESPFCTHIHLTVDRKQRFDTLVGLCDKKLDVASKLLLERARFLDLRHEYCVVDRFQLPSGEYILSRFEVVPFGRGFTVERIFDELVLFMRQADMSITDHANVVTILENEEALTPSVQQTRLVYALGEGIEVEANAVLFSRFSESDNCGVFAVDFVNQDDLYPNATTRRIQKDLTGGGFVAECPADDDGPPVVCMTRWMSVRLHKAPFPLTRAHERVVREKCRAIGDVMAKAMLEKLGLR